MAKHEERRRAARAIKREIKAYMLKTAWKTEGLHLPREVSRGGLTPSFVSEDEEDFDRFDSDQGQKLGLLKKAAPVIDINTNERRTSDIREVFSPIYGFQAT
jgi:hypothetical protein